MFSRVFVAAVASLPFVAQVAFAASCTRSYTVAEGDYCDKISAANNVSTYQLAALNFPTVNAGCTNLMPGQQICLGSEGEDCTATYVIQPDDTCAKVMSTFGVNSTILAHNNPQIDSECSNIYIGQVLCVATAGLVPSAPAGVIINPTPVVITQSTAAAQATPSPALAVPSDDSTDDENLPWCDEL